MKEAKDELEKQRAELDKFVNQASEDTTPDDDINNHRAQFDKIQEDRKKLLIPEPFEPKTEDLEESDLSPQIEDDVETPVKEDETESEKSSETQEADETSE